jgi:hypothetical protein
MKFEWHPPKAESNLAKHGVSFEEAQEAFEDDYGVIFCDDRNSMGEVRYRLIGGAQTRLLVVIYIIRHDELGQEVTRLISAREAEDWEKRQYYE